YHACQSQRLSLGALAETKSKSSGITSRQSRRGVSALAWGSGLLGPRESHTIPQTKLPTVFATPRVVDSAVACRAPRSPREPHHTADQVADCVRHAAGGQARGAYWRRWSDERAYRPAAVVPRQAPRGLWGWGGARK